VTVKSTQISWAQIWLGNWRRFFVLRQFLLPGTRLRFKDFYSRIDFLRLPGINHPHYLDARFLISELHPDHIAWSQVMLNAGEFGATAADLLDVDILEKWTALGHPPDSNQQVEL